MHVTVISFLFVCLSVGSIVLICYGLESIFLTPSVEQIALEIQHKPGT